MTTRRRRHRQAVAETHPRRSRILLWAFLGVVAIAAGAWGIYRSTPQREGTTPVAVPAKPKLNVLLIVVDTLRADRLGCYGSNLGATPNIDALAAQSVRFEHAYAHAPWTLPSFASLLTSLPPPRHGAGGQLGQFRPMAPGVRTVAESFDTAGYATGGVINVDFLSDLFGVTRGFTEVDFEAYGNNSQVRNATKTTDAAVKWLSTPGKRPFLLMVHYFDPHLVYDPPPEYRRKFAAPEDQNDPNWVFGTLEQVIAYRQGKITFDASTIQRAEKLYNGEVAYTDHEVGRLLDELAKLGLADSTVVAFTADHGEEFFDHGGFEHGHTLYNELMHVPLCIRVPGGPKPSVVSAAVGLMDVAPTLCALTGVAPDPGFAGRNLLKLIDGTDPAERPIVMEGNFWGPPFRGWLCGGYKLIDGPRGLSLFNLQADPGEKTELNQAEPDRLQRMFDDLRLAFREMAAKAPGQMAPVELSPQELARLKSLGYIGDDSPPVPPKAQ
jgi:arylsulfatase A-like enzyme